MTDAVRDGDLLLKAGKCLYLHRVSGVKAQRVAVVAVGKGEAKAVKTGAAAGMALLKAPGVKHLAVQLVGQDALAAAHAEAVVAAVGDAAYLYRATKPSAPAAPALQKISLLTRCVRYSPMDGPVGRNGSENAIRPALPTCGMPAWRCVAICQSLNVCGTTGLTCAVPMKMLRCS